jgi:electron transfer flavoprotein beta subunit
VTQEPSSSVMSPSGDIGLSRVLVPLKRVIDYAVPVRVRQDRSGIVTDGVRMTVNPFDEIALEEALRIRERGEAREVVVVSVGSEACEPQLRTGLAMGADRAIRVSTTADLEPLDVARALLAVIQRERPDLVLMGKQATDTDHAQTGPMLAGLWGRPQATFASRIELGSGAATVTREVDAGHALVSIELPAVITVDLRLNEPRYVKLPDLLKARRKPIETVSLQACAQRDRPQFAIERIDEPEPRPQGTRVGDVPALIVELQKRGLLDS